MTSHKYYYIPMVFQRWDSQKLTLGFSLASKMPDGSIGFMPVFGTHSEAQDAFPENEIVVIEQKDSQP